MSIFIAMDSYVIKCENKFYLASQHYSIFERYHNAFGLIKVCCRVREVETVDLNYTDVTAWIEEIIPIRSLLSALLGMRSKDIKMAMKGCELAIGRFHSISGCIASDCARSLKKPFFAEVMGDAWDGYWNHGIIGKLFAPYIFLKTRKSIKHADYALYVTNRFLQKRYPCNNQSVAVSNVRISRLDRGVLEKRVSRINNREPSKITLMTTAAVDVRYKGQEYVIRAIPLINKSGLMVKYTLVGGGNQDYLRKVARSCGVEKQIVFAGRMSLDDVYKQIDHQK